MFVPVLPTLCHCISYRLYVFFIGNALFIVEFMRLDFSFHIPFLWGWFIHSDLMTVYCAFRLVPLTYKCFEMDLWTIRFADFIRFFCFVHALLLKMFALIVKIIRKCEHLTTTIFNNTSIMTWCKAPIQYIAYDYGQYNSLLSWLHVKLRGVWRKQNANIFLFAIQVVRREFRKRLRG